MSYAGTVPGHMTVILFPTECCMLGRRSKMAEEARANNMNSTSSPNPTSLSEAVRLLERSVNLLKDNTAPVPNQEQSTSTGCTSAASRPNTSSAGLLTARAVSNYRSANSAKYYISYSIWTHHHSFIFYINATIVLYKGLLCPVLAREL